MNAGGELLDLLVKWAALEFSGGEGAAEEATSEAEWLAAPLAAAQRTRAVKELPKEIAAPLTRQAGNKAVLAGCSAMTVVYPALNAYLCVWVGVLRALHTVPASGLQQ